jgi:hypothetical protein
MLTGAAFVHRFGLSALGRGDGEPRIAACRIAVRDMAAVEEILVDNEVPAERVGQRLVAPPSVAFGAAIAFEAVTD